MAMKEKPPNYGITPVAFLGLGTLILVGVAILAHFTVPLVSSWFH